MFSLILFFRLTDFRATCVLGVLYIDCGPWVVTPCCLAGGKTVTVHKSQTRTQSIPLSPWYPQNPSAVALLLPFLCILGVPPETGCYRTGITVMGIQKTNMLNIIHRRVKATNCNKIIYIVTNYWFKCAPSEALSCIPLSSWLLAYKCVKYEPTAYKRLG